MPETVGTLRQEDPELEDSGATYIERVPGESTTYIESTRRAWATT